MPTELVSNFAMIDVGGKRVTTRRAVAAGTIRLGPAAYAKVASKTLPKGDCFPMAEIAGVMGAKGASALLPMCHPLTLDQVLVRFEMDADARALFDHYNCGLPDPQSPTELWQRLDGLMRWMTALATD